MKTTLSNINCSVLPPSVKLSIANNIDVNGLDDEFDIREILENLGASESICVLNILPIDITIKYKILYEIIEHFTSSIKLLSESHKIKKQMSILKKYGEEKKLSRYDALYVINEVCGNHLDNFAIKTDPVLHLVECPIDLISKAIIKAAYFDMVDCVENLIRAVRAINMVTGGGGELAEWKRSEYNMWIVIKKIILNNYR